MEMLCWALLAKDKASNKQKVKMNFFIAGKSFEKMRSNASLLNVSVTTARQIR